MSDLLKMFTIVHGNFSSNFKTEIVLDETGDEIAIAVIKDGDECWRKDKLEILFEYIIQVTNLN